MKINEAINQSYKVLSPISRTAKLDVEVLLAYILNKKNRLDLYLNQEQELNPKELDKFLNLINERHQLKPISKIINQKSFWNFDLDLSYNVLIPRPETEVLIDLVTKKISQNKKMKFLDIGCGSGCISLALLDYFYFSSGVAIDVSKEAILNTQLNLKKFNFKDRLKLLRQDVFKFHSTNKFDLIISNPPYLKLSDYINLDKSIKQYEPKEALIGDSRDGTMFYKKIIVNLKNNLKLGGYFAFEIGDYQMIKIEKILNINGFRIEEKFKLINNQTRCLLAKKIKNYTLQ